MSSSTGAPNRRHRPSAAIQEFLDPLDPGFYYDSGLARLRGLDDALVAEARSRGRVIGEDAFQLVATDSGLVYCRPSISFAVAARWEELEIAEPIGDDPAILVSTWPTHGELRFTTSRRLAENLFHRWARLHRKVDEPEPRVVEASAVPGGGPETWEMVSKLKVRQPRQILGEVTAPGKVDRRQKPDVLRRRRQEQAETAGRGRHPAGTGPRRQAWRQRWAIDGAGPNPPVPPYDIPPIPEAPAKPVADDAADRRSTPASIDRAVPARSARSTTEVSSTDGAVADMAPKADEAGMASEPDVVPEAGMASEPDVAPEADVVPEADLASESDREPVADDHQTPNAARPALADAELRTVPVPRPAPTFGSKSPSRSQPQAQVVPGWTGRSMVAEPSWIGSPASLIGAMVVVSSLVLVATVSAGLYRRSSATESGVDPAGPSVEVVDHQRFSPAADVPARTPADAEGVVVVSGSGRLSQTTGPTSPPTTGSGTAPMTSLLEWPPAEGPQTCNSNYSGCVPDVVDVDCPGDGDGPIYWPESATVMGEDVYELDTDGDGEICEPDQPANAP